MRKVLLLPVFLIVAFQSFAQSPKLDSLRHRLSVSKDDKAALKGLLALCEEDESLTKDSLWNYAVKAKEIASKLKDENGKGLAILAQAHAYLRWGNIDSARFLVESEIKKVSPERTSTRDLYFKLQQAEIDCIGDADNYKDATAVVFRLMKEAERYKDSVYVASAMNTLGAWNYDMDLLDQSKAWYYKALAYTSSSPSFYYVKIGICANMSDYYRWIKKLDSADLYAAKAFYLNHNLHNLFYEALILQRLAAIAMTRKDFGKAEQLMLKSIEVSEKYEGKAPQQDKLVILSAIYEKSGQLDKAIALLNNGIARDSAMKYHSVHMDTKSNSSNLQRVFYDQELAKCYRLKGDSKKYEETLEKIIDGKDAFYKANSADAIAELQTKYEVQKKEATIAEQNLALAKSNYLFYGSLIFLALGVTIAWLIYRDLGRKQALKLRNVQEEEKQLADQAVVIAKEGERRRIAADLHDNLGAQLSVIKRNVNFILDQPDGFTADEERKHLGLVNDVAQDAMIDLRETIWVLHKDEVLIQEFADKLKSYLRQQLMSRELIRWDFREEIDENWRLSSGEVMHLFRIVQEAISNIIRHSGAELINIALISKITGTYLIEIEDNGKGFENKDFQDGHYGLENMEKRSAEIQAKLAIVSKSGEGTKITLSKGQK